MDIFCRWKIVFDKICETRARVKTLGTLLESQPRSRRTVALYTELIQLDRTVADRAEQLLGRRNQVDAMGQGIEELELDIELVAHLERKMALASALLKRELEPHKGFEAVGYEEPLG